LKRQDDQRRRCERLRARAAQREIVLLQRLTGGEWKAAGFPVQRLNNRRTGGGIAYDRDRDRLLGFVTDIAHVELADGAPNTPDVD